MKSTIFVVLSGCLATVTMRCEAADVHEAIDAVYPGALGWAADTPGGRGGRILRVTNLSASGPGSLREALEADGRRIIVFEVAGVIALDRRSLSIRNPYVTIAGQTAPAPGVTIIQGGISIQTHDVILRHLRVRPGEAGAAKNSGWEVDAIDRRIVQQVREGTSGIPDNEREVGGYPDLPEVRRGFDASQWDVSTITPR